MSTVATRGGAYLAGNGFALVQIYERTRLDSWDALPDIAKLVGLAFFAGVPLAGIWFSIAMLQNAEREDKQSQIAMRGAEKAAVSAFILCIGLWLLTALDLEVPPPAVG